MSYRPQQNSTPARVLAWFKANPEEELTRSDLAVKFDLALNSVGGSLLLAVRAGLLHITRNRLGQSVYRLGRGPKTTTEACHG